MKQVKQEDGCAVQGSGLCLMLLTGSPDSFFRLSKARTAMEAQLRDGGRLQVRRPFVTAAASKTEAPALTQRPGLLEIATG